MKNIEKVILMNILGGMDEYIREYGDDDVTERWLAYGVPDGADEDTLSDIADDLEEVADIMRTFARRLDQIALIESGEEEDD